jgi:hypothetical protein
MAILAECPICHKKQATRKPLEATAGIQEVALTGASNPNCKRSVPSHPGVRRRETRCLPLESSLPLVSLLQPGQWACLWVWYCCCLVIDLIS